jgi:hypothetical protein
MKSANPLYCKNVACKQQSSGSADWLIQAFEIRIEQRKSRAAAFTCDGLSVMPSVLWVAVLLFTFRAHWKVNH